MNPRWHRVLTQVFLLTNSLFWLPWGLINLIWPESWAGEVIPNMNVYDLSSAVARTEVRAMYGGLQMAIGTFGPNDARVAPEHDDPARFVPSFRRACRTWKRQRRAGRISKC